MLRADLSAFGASRELEMTNDPGTGQDQVSEQELPPQWPRLVMCTICCFAFAGAQAYKNHTYKRDHKMAVKSCGLEEDPGLEECQVDESGRFVHCALCSENLGVREWHSHLDSPQHVKAMTLAASNTDSGLSPEDKQGVVLMGENTVDFGYLTSQSSAQKLIPSDRAYAVSKTIKIKNTSTTRVYLVSTESRKQRLDGTASSSFNIIKPSGSYAIEPNSSVKVFVEFHPKDKSGKHEETIEYYFTNIFRTQYFAITRSLVARIGGTITS
ncbi:hypothetical protein DFH11DRAFT_1069509 [Phellopilus nigrolimitatus]|nr:hypothetical protein DFH11DRAFT_1069509 [Phellopilus nigrolimitatus]